MAITYPRHILIRRMKLLTKAETARVRRFYRRLQEIQQEKENVLDSLDEVIGSRAEKENDPWR